MGWTSAGDTRGQVRLSFESREAAIDYAERHGLAYTIQEPRRTRPTLKAYADNFSWSRLDAWTH